MVNIPLDNFNDFQDACKHFGIEMNNNQLDLFKRYYQILIEWNKKINLISRKEENILEKHFLDSIVFLPEIDDLCRGLINQAPTVFDIGSGGGFPGIPLAIMKPEWQFTLCESIKKKANFLEHLIKELGLPAGGGSAFGGKTVDIINARVETCHGMSLQSKFDLITARAVGKLDLLIKYALPLLKKGGYLLAYKSKDIEDEIKSVEKNKLKIFSKEINEVERKLVVIQMLQG